MTIAITLKVGDGIVLGADSASTLSSAAGIVNVYFNAEKLFNLVKGLPLGVVTAGVGSLQGRSITSLSKDLRLRLSTRGDPWHLDPDKYTVEDAANRIRDFFYTDVYEPEYRTAPEKPLLSFLIAGFPAGAAQGEIWSVEIGGGTSVVACEVGRDVSGVARWRGMPEALNRLVRGYSPAVYERLVQEGIAPDAAQAFLRSVQVEPLIEAGMPIQDAIDLVHYLIEVTSGFVRFAPGAPMVHHPIDSAAITPHEGFRWVRRKHYFDRTLNQPIARYPIPEAT